MVWLFQRFGRLTATEHVPAAGSLRFRLLASNIQVVNSEVVAVSCRNEDFEKRRSEGKRGCLHEDWTQRFGFNIRRREIRTIEREGMIERWKQQGIKFKESVCRLVSAVFKIKKVRTGRI